MTSALRRFATSSSPRAVSRSATMLVGGAFALAMTLGCTKTGSTRLRPPGHVAPSDVTDEGFAQAVHDVLLDGGATAQRQALLEGVVRRQLAHAAERLKARERERGVESVYGALYLVRPGELRAEMIDEAGDQALAQAIDVVASAGDEGRSAAFYDLRRLALPPAAPERADIDEHLSAISRWIADTERPEAMKPTALAGRQERRLVARALLLPTDEALHDATAATAKWIDAGIDFQTRFQGRQLRESGWDREEAVEGLRAVTSGAATMAALYLRNGDAAGAYEAMTRTSVARVTPPGLLQRIESAAHPGDATSWKLLLQLFSKREERDEETSIDRALLRAAQFGIAVEAYRREPTSAEIDVALASALTELGMPEVAPLVLADSAASQNRPDPAMLSGMLEGVARSMLHEEAADDPASAIRVFQSSARLLSLADQPEVKPRLSLSPARFRLLAAGVEARAGELPQAKALLEASLHDENGAEALRLLAEAERQLGNVDAALARLAQVAASPEASRDRLIEADARLEAADIRRERGDAEGAAKELAGARAAAEAARKAAQSPGVIARAERALARIYDRQGDAAAAAKATERAITASRTDARQLGAAILDAVARAYIARDLPAARRAAREAIGAAIPADELVYIGIWLHFLERETNETTDGTAARLLDDVERGASWTGRLAAWASGKIGDAELTAAARTPAQRTEAAFYRAIAQRAAGQAAAAEAQLREVARSSALELMESQIARELLSPRVAP